MAPPLLAATLGEWGLDRTAPTQTRHTDKSGAPRFPREPTDMDNDERGRLTTLGG